MKLGKILGIDVSLHWTLFLLIAWTGLSAPLGGTIGSTLFISAIFGCVLLHEFGHSLAARQFGIETHSIKLYPIGGVATLERMPREPRQELWIAIAGPLVNVAIAVLVFLLRAQITSSPQVHAWLSYLMAANIGLVVFNMLPAFPMDGGRVFRAIAAMLMPYVQATNLAASVGKVVACGLALVGFYYGHWMLMLIAAFVFFVGSAEARAVAEDFAKRPCTLLRDGQTLRTLRDGRSILVVWDDARQVYRYAS